MFTTISHSNRTHNLGAMLLVKSLFEPLFGDTCIYREHPLFPGSKMAIYACELDGELHIGRNM